MEAPMLTLVHSPQSRPTRILWMLEETDLPYEAPYASITRQDGSGRADANNPHPAKKMPVLIDIGRKIIVSSANDQAFIMMPVELAATPRHEIGAVVDTNDTVSWGIDLALDLLLFGP
jgi:hypothetical protein